MKKLALALTAFAALGGQAVAADMAVKASRPAPPPVVVANWTGCYISGGGGYGLWHQENTGYIDPPFVAVRTQATPTATAGGKGWFGTVQGGCDYQFSTGPWAVVVGAFGDYDFADIHGQINLPTSNFYGNEKLSSQWAVGGRIGVLVTPQLLTYVAGGYTEAKFDQVNFDLIAGAPPVVFPGFGQYWNSQTYGGWFFGSGYEYALSFLPGLYWKTEYRASWLDRETNFNRFVGPPGGVAGALTGFSYDSEKWVHTVRSQLVYRFNFGGPAVAARY
jgi:outer membrane immunogenic protein